MQRFGVEVEPGVELSVIDFGGSGPLLLLSHANGFCAAMWRRVVERLSEDCRVLAIDARGHGESSVPAGREAYHWGTLAEDICKVARHGLARTGAERVALAVGHSFGGTCTLGAAARDTALFGRVLVLDPVILPRSMMVRPAKGAASGSRRAGNHMAAGARARRAVFASRAVAREGWSQKSFFQSWDRQMLEDYVAEGLRDREDGQVELKCAPEVEATVFQTGGTLDLYSVADRIGAPVLFKWAEKGNFSRAAYEELAALMAEGRVENAPTGHLIPMEAPAWVAAQLDALLQS